MAVNEFITLRQFINDDSKQKELKIYTFCSLMKKVCLALENYSETEMPIKINLDNIKIGVNFGEIRFDSLVQLDNQNMDKTMVDLRTGVSLLADRKATEENKNIAFALMVLGWYVNEDGNAISSDMQVLENFDLYLSKVPMWLHDFFISIFKNMNQNESFAAYYNRKFVNVINNKINTSANEMGLDNVQTERFSKLVIKDIKNSIKRDDNDDEELL